MKKGMILVLAVALLAVATTANAQVFGKGKAQFSLGLVQFTAHTVDTLLSPFVGFGVISLGNASQFLQDDRMLGFGGFFKWGFSEHWALDLGGFFGFGSDKVEWGSNGETKASYQAFGGRLGLDYTENIGDMFGVYFGPGFELVSAKSSLEDGFFYGAPAIDEDNDRTIAFSLDGRIGVQAKLGRNFGLNANLGQKWSRVSGSFDTDFGAGPEEVKISRWVSSMNGFAGFVIYVN